MDELEILKKDWNKERLEDKKLSLQEIYPMLQKKSSSIVKMLFHISIAELVFWILVNTIPYFTSNIFKKRLDAIYTNEYIFTGITIFSYVIIFLFIYLLFKAHKTISVTDNAKKLMESILNTRKVIKYYVIYNLVLAFISLVIGMYLAIANNPEVSETISNLDRQQTLITFALFVIVIAVFVCVIWLFYKLLYGLLLKRLNQNYSELKKLEV
jgi:hypothetical protein